MINSSFSITKIVKFDAAHRLPGYDGDCADVHGHTWKVEIEVGLVDGYMYDPEQEQMLMDFKDLKAIIEDRFLDKFDHAYLNMLGIDILEYPSAENITLYIREMIADQVPEKLQLQRVRVWESEDSYAEWRLP